MELEARYENERNDRSSWPSFTLISLFYEIMIIRRSMIHLQSIRNYACSQRTNIRILRKLLPPWWKIYNVITLSVAYIFHCLNSAFNFKEESYNRRRGKDKGSFMQRNTDTIRFKGTLVSWKGGKDRCTANTVDCVTL